MKNPRMLIEDRKQHMRNENVQMILRYMQSLRFDGLREMARGIVIDEEEKKAFRRHPRSKRMGWIAFFSRFSSHPNLPRLQRCMFINFQYLLQLELEEGVDHYLLNSYVKVGSVDGTLLNRFTAFNYPAWLQFLVDLAFVDREENITIVMIEVDSFCSNTFYVRSWCRALERNTPGILDRITLFFGRVCRDYDHNSARVTLRNLYDSLMNDHNPNHQGTDVQRVMFAMMYQEFVRDAIWHQANRGAELPDDDWYRFMDQLYDIHQLE